EAKSTTRTKSFRLRGLTFEKIAPEVLFYGASGRIFMLFGVLPDSNNILTMHRTITKQQTTI
ncbi:MAG: hypothetical protein MSA05_03300, partial [Prevotella sp.]|uniref:hypothetical protein n=1 Tax=Prevotella sp. TaxID=59823 RepID=UPI0025F12877